MHVNRGLLGWGLFLVTLGAVPLAVRAGYLDAATVARAWELWPLVLVGIGLGLVLQRTRAALVGGLVVALTFGTMGGSLLAVGWSGGFAGCRVGAGSGNGIAFTTRSGTLGGNASVDLALSCGELTVTPGTGSAWMVAGSDDRGGGPQVQDAADRLRVETGQRPGIGIGAAGDRWQVTLPADPRLDLSISLNAGSARLDLSGMHVPDAGFSVTAGDLRVNLARAAEVGSLEASANAGSLKVSLPAASMTGSLSANVGSVDVCVPAGVGLRFTGSDEPLGSNNFGSRGLVKQGGTWTTPGFDAATARIQLAASANLGSINLNPENGCD
jgi:hypothetical protein